MKQVFHLDQILLPLWLAASESSCVFEVTSLPPARPATGVMDAQMNSPNARQPYRRPKPNGVIMDMYDMRPRVADVDAVVIMPSYVSTDVQITDALNQPELLFMVTPQELARRCGETNERNTLLANAWSAAWLFRCGETLDQLVLKNMLMVTGADVPDT